MASSNTTFHIPDAWWGWLIPVALLCGGWIIKTLRDSLLQKNADLIVKKLLEPDNSGISPIQKVVREELMQQEWQMESIRRAAEATRGSHYDE